MSAAGRAPRAGVLAGESTGPQNTSTTNTDPKMAIIASTRGSGRSASRNFSSATSSSGLVGATVYARNGQDLRPGYQLVSREIDPGNLWLIYGVRSLKRRG